ncbi:eukaryotic translation initiation factor 3 subunit I-like [Ananas comosus]|uniref:Eukaryotic translation initiation factor 3 subunit I-like n=1 Tax=Ananas comosus TaxID=4615 RepID=A0A6P5GEJ0_ANACO|nr:eukaryotic translation initiation factor 3 subunit I-like [Ananas comosus]
MRPILMKGHERPLTFLRYNREGDLQCYVSGTPETGKLFKEAGKDSGHQKTITPLSKSGDGSHFLTGSLEKTAKLRDARTLTLLKTYATERPVNAGAISRLLDHLRTHTF